MKYVVTRYVPQKKKKARIPARVRQLCWLEYNGENFKGVCQCCNEMITVWNFQAGHIVSEADGGEIKVDNLIPLCQQCNLSMGTKNFDEFKENHNFLNSVFNKYKYENKNEESNTIKDFLESLT